MWFVHVVLKNTWNLFPGPMPLSAGHICLCLPKDLSVLWWESWRSRFVQVKGQKQHRLGLGEGSWFGLNYYFVKVRGASISGNNNKQEFQAKNNINWRFETVNKQWYPMIRSDVLLTHPSTPTFPIHTLCHSITTPPYFLLCCCHNHC